jgi:hypothetical protein
LCPRLVAGRGGHDASQGAIQTRNGVQAKASEYCYYLFHPVEIKFWVAKLLMSRRTPIPIGVLRWTIKCLHFVHITGLSAYVSIVLKNTSGATSVHPLYSCRLFKNSGICCKMGWRIQRSLILLIRRLSLTVSCPQDAMAMGGQLQVSEIFGHNSGQ